MKKMEINEMSYKYDEIKSYFEAYIMYAYITDEYKDNDFNFLEDIHHHVFKDNYYIISNHQAKKWLGENVFKVFGVIQEYEKFNFGESHTNLSSPKSVVNMYAYIVGEYIVNNWREKFEFVRTVFNICELCNNKYYIFTFNTKSNADEIQKCDCCNVYKTDEEAIQVSNYKEVQ